MADNILLLSPKSIRTDSIARGVILSIVTHPVFDRIVLVLILANCISIAIQGSSSSNILEAIFLAIFVAELSLKVIAHGISFFSDGWNILDSLIVVAGFISLLTELGTFSVLRVLRVARPMRTINRIPGMRHLVNTLLTALTMMNNVLLLSLIFFYCFGSLGLWVWQDSFLLRCRPNDYPKSPIGVPCSNTTYGHCETGSVCTSVSTPYVNQFAHFGHIGAAAILLVQCITLDNWTEYYYVLETASHPAVAIYFIIVTMIGAHFLFNLVMAMVIASFARRSSDVSHRYEERRIGLGIVSPEERRLSLSIHRSNRSHTPESVNTEEIIESNNQSNSTPRTNANASGASNISPGDVSVSMEPLESNTRNRISRWSFSLSPRNRTWSPQGSVDKSTSKNRSASLPHIHHKPNWMSELRSLSWSGESQSSQNHPVQVQGPSRPAPLLAGSIYAVTQPTTPSFQRHLYHSQEMELQQVFLQASFRSIMPSTPVDSLSSTEEPIPTTETPFEAPRENYSFGANYNIWENIRERISRFINHRLFEPVVSLLVVLNAIVLALEHADQSAEWTESMEIANWVFIVIFTIEIFLRILVDWRNWFSHGFTIFDTVVVAFSWVEAFLLRNSALNVVRILRIIRIARVLRLAHRWHALHRILNLITSSLPYILYLILIMVLFAFVFAVLGQQLFSGSQIASAKSTDPLVVKAIHRANFDSFYWSSITVFRLLTRDRWAAIMYLYMDVTSVWALIYFYSAVIFGGYLLMNLFVAILVVNLEKDAQWIRTTSQQEKWDMRHVAYEASEQLRIGSKLRRRIPFTPAVQTQLRTLFSLQQSTDLAPTHGHELFDRTEKRKELGSFDSSNSINNNTSPLLLRLMLRRGNYNSNEIPTSTAVANNTSNRKRGLSTRIQRLTLTHGRLYDNQNGLLGVETLEETLLRNPSLRRRRQTHPSGRFCDVTRIEIDDESSESLHPNTPPGSTRRVTFKEHNIEGSRRRAISEPPRSSNSFDYNDSARSASVVAVRSLPTIQSLPTAVPPIPIQRDTSRNTDQDVGGRVTFDSSSTTTATPGPSFSSPSVPSNSEFLDCGPLEGDLVSMSLNLFPINHPLRSTLLKTIRWRHFELIPAAVIIINCVQMALHTPAVDDDPQQSFWFSVADNVFSIIFFLELVMRVIAYGLYQEPTCYLNRSKWNRMDAIIILLSVALTPLQYFTNYVDLVRVISALRSVRPLRMVVRSYQLQTILLALAETVPAVIHISAVSLLFTFVFAVVGLQWFAGSFRSCNDSSITDRAKCVGVYNFTMSYVDLHEYSPRYIPKFIAPGVVQAERKWDNFANFNFDNLIRSLLSLLDVVVQTDWGTIMYAGVDAVNPESAPQFNYRPYMALYFVLFIVVCGWFTLNIYIGVLVDHFTQIRKLYNGSAFLTESQQEWIRIKRMVLRASAGDVITAPPNMNKIQYYCYSIVSFKLTWHFGQMAGVDRIKQLIWNWQSNDMAPTLDSFLNVVQIAEHNSLLQNVNLRSMIQSLPSKWDGILEQICIEEERLTITKQIYKDLYRMVGDKDSPNEDTISNMFHTIHAHIPKGENPSKQLGDLQKLLSYYHRNLPSTWQPLLDFMNRESKRIGRVFEIQVLDSIVSVLIILNAVTLTTVHYQQSEVWTDLQWLSNILFASILTLEMLLKLLLYFSFSIYISKINNKLDCLVVITSWIELVISWAFPLWTGNSILYILRLIRIIRIIRKHKGMRSLWGTLVYAIPAFLNVLSLLLLTFLFYGILGVTLFGRVRVVRDSHNMLNQHANFNDFIRSCLTLYRVVTFDTWTLVRNACAIQPPYCDPDKGECGWWWVSTPYFSSFIVLAGFVMMNLFIALVQEHFHTVEAISFDVQSKLDKLIKFREAWSALDHNSDRIPVGMFVPFMLQLDPPIGFKGCKHWQILPSLAHLNILLTTDMNILLVDAVTAVSELLFHVRLVDKSVKSQWLQLKHRTAIYSPWAAAQWYAAAIIGHAVRARRVGHRCLRYLCAEHSPQRLTRVAIVDTNNNQRTSHNHSD